MVYSSPRGPSPFGLHRLAAPLAGRFRERSEKRTASGAAKQMLSPRLLWQCEEQCHFRFRPHRAPAALTDTP
jgi:hypothetical protein